jgi:hypothetical protein
MAQKYTTLQDESLFRLKKGEGQHIFGTQVGSAYDPDFTNYLELTQRGAEKARETNEKMKFNIAQKGQELERAKFEETERSNLVTEQRLAKLDKEEASRATVKQQEEYKTGHQLRKTESAKRTQDWISKISSSVGTILATRSDERLKDIKGNFVKGLNAILGLKPINFTWKKETGMESESINSGFSAQQVREFIPEAVKEDDEGILSIADRTIIATLVNAVKELNDKVTELQKTQ